MTAAHERRWTLARSERVSTSPYDVSYCVQQPVSVTAGPEAIAEAKGATEAVMSGLGSLSPVRAMCISARFGLDGSDRQTLRQIADSQGMPLSTVDGCIRRGLRQLRTDHPHLKDFLILDAG